MFQQLLDEWAEAIVANDPQRIGAFATPGWQLVDTGGIIPLSKFLHVVRSGELTHDTMSFKCYPYSPMVTLRWSLRTARTRSTGRANRFPPMNGPRAYLYDGSITGYGLARH